MKAIRVQVVYALENRQFVLALRLPEGSTVADALSRSRVFELHPEIDPEQVRPAIWGRTTRPDQRLDDRDRVELLRPLRTEPKAARRDRARKEPVSRN